MKQKVDYTIRIDEDLLNKAEVLAEIEGQTLNNMISALIRQSVSYHERVHGNITVKKYK